MQKEQNNEQHNTQAKGLVLPNVLLGGGGRMYFISIPTHPPPTQRTYLFFLQLTLHLPLKNTIKIWVYPLKSMGQPLKNMLPLKNLVKIKASSSKNSTFFSL